MQAPKFIKKVGGWFGIKATDGGTVTFVQFLQQLKAGKVEYYTEWVYAGFVKIAQSLARVEWELYQQKGKDVQEVLDSHPLLGLLYTFNGKTTRYEATAKTILGFLLDGEVGWYMGEKRGNKPTAIYVVPKSNYRVLTRDNFGYPTQYEVSTVDGGKLTVPQQDFLVIKNINPNSNERGYSVLEALRDVAETDFYIARWNKNLMKNDAQPSGIVKLPQGALLDEKQQEILRKEVQDAMGGYENAHKVTILGGGAELEQTALNPKDLDFNNGRAFNRDLLLAIIGTPKTLLGLDNGVTKATAETAERIFAKYTLEPILEQVCEWLNEYLVPAFGDNLWLGFHPLASEDREQVLNELDRGYNRWLTTNEARAQVGLDPINGGDYIYMPLSNLPMVGGTQNPAKAQEGLHYIKVKGTSMFGRVGYVAPKKAGYIKSRIAHRGAYKKLLGEEAADKVASKVAEKLEQKNAGKVLKIAVKGFTPEQKLAHWQGYVERKRAQDNNFAKLFASIFEKQKQLVLNNIKNHGAKGAEFKVSAHDLMFEKEAEIKATVAIIEPQYYALVTEGLAMAGEMLGMEPAQITDIPALMEWIKKVADKYGTSVTETTYDQLAGILQSGLQNGDGIYELGNAVEDYFGTVAPARADMIARTESARAMTASEAYAWDSYGIKAVEWYLAGGDPCEICIGNAAKNWTVEQAQKGISDYSHPNCECVFLPL